MAVKRRSDTACGATWYSSPAAKRLRLARPSSSSVKSAGNNAHGRVARVVKDDDRSDPSTLNAYRACRWPGWSGRIRIGAGRHGSNPQWRPRPRQRAKPRGSAATAIAKWGRAALGKPVSSGRNEASACVKLESVLSRWCPRQRRSGAAGLRTCSRATAARLQERNANAQSRRRLREGMQSHYKQKASAERTQKRGGVLARHRRRRQADAPQQVEGGRRPRCGLPRGTTGCRVPSAKPRSRFSL